MTACPRSPPIVWDPNQNGNWPFCGNSSRNLDVLTQDDARKIARKLMAEIKPGRRHDLAVLRYKGVRVGQFGISRSSKEQSHDYISRQLYITAKHCREFLDCSLTLEGYFQILATKQLLPPSR